jgi:thiaminase/transcriptional activator TenA
MDLSDKQHILPSGDDKKESILTEYVAYMNRQLEKEGLLAGLTALLQCSWVYAYISQTCMERYSKDINTSPYRDWFEAYTSKDYLDANQAWIQALDKLATDISPEAADKLCRIFLNCAAYENRFWDRLAQVIL